MILVTGASDNHVRSLRQFIASFIRHTTAGKHRLLVWNLGITDWASIQTPHPHIGYEVFDFTKYPDWFDITKDAGQYAWKPAIMRIVAARHPAEIIVWMDAGNIVVDPLRNLERFLRSNALYSSYSVGKIRDWTHPATVTALSGSGSLGPAAPSLNALNRNGACIGFNLSAERARLCLEEWATACANKDILAPVGSSRANHRQDQSVFSILYYKYVGSDAVSNVFLGYTIHNDVD